MRCRQKYCFENILGNTQAPGDEPSSSNNICLLYSSSKTLVFTILLHLHVTDFEAEPLVTERLREHLSSVKADIDVHSLEKFLSAIVTNLLASCDLLNNLNQRGRLTEDEKKCMAHFNSSKYCVNVIRSIALWLNLIFGRAKYMMKVITDADSSDIKVLQLVEAIKRLGGSRFFDFAVQSLTKSLTAIVGSASRNVLSKSLINDGCLEQSFRSCLGAMRSSIALVHVCSASNSPEVKQSQGNEVSWNAAAKTYLSFVVSCSLMCDYPVNLCSCLKT